jgi:hypothetical protein
MKPNTTELSITYFPHTFMEYNDIKRLALYFDSVHLLQVLPDFDLGLPALLRTSSLVQSFCPMSSSSLTETITRAQKIYHQLASVHPNGGLLQLLQTYALQEDIEHTRTGLVSHIRQGLTPLAPEEVELVNDAVFLLFAHELDREHLELDLKLDNIRDLETRLHQEVGIGTDEEREALAVKSPLLLESDHLRTRYPFQRLRAWTRLYSMQPEPGRLQPLTTSVEVLAEISERLPSLLTTATDGSAPTPLSQLLLSILPDPQPLSLEQILELRDSLNRDGTLDNWRQSATTAINRLQEEALAEEQWRDLQENLQKSADNFLQHWPALDKPAGYLRLESMLYPHLRPELVFSLTTGLLQPDPGLLFSKGNNGITLLLSPSALR